jgi:preprotein translocase subunit SecG
MSHHEHAPHAEEHPDAWHAHGAEEGEPQPEHGAKASPVGLAVAFGIMTVLFLATCVVLGMYFYKEKARLQRERSETTTMAEGYLGLTGLEQGSYQIQEQVEKSYGTYTWVDESDPQSQVQIPIDHAIDQVIEEYRGGN